MMQALQSKCNLLALKLTLNASEGEAKLNHNLKEKEQKKSEG